MFVILALSIGAPPSDLEMEKAKAAVAVAVAMAKLNESGTPTDLDKPAPPGWEKVSVDGGPWHFRKITAAPGVAAPQTFRTGTFHAGHACPSCGRNQYVVAGFNRD